MHGEINERDSIRADRVELILRELDSLPTLGAVAVRLLELTADDDSEASDVIELVASDPSLASRVLKLCRCHERGRADNVTSVDRAVLLLGFEAVRCAVLSVQVFELLDGMGSPCGERCDGAPVFDREAFWLHSLGVAVTSEAIVGQGTLTQDIRPSDAFMSGLLHDLGQLVLHVLLPETFDQVCRVAETHSISLDRACRRIIGIDTHTTGKRLAESWGLPQSLIDVIWLNGQPQEGLPHVPHRSLISAVSLADALVRNHYITPGAHWARNDNVSALCVPIGIRTEQTEAIIADLHEKVARRAEAMGMSSSHDPSVLLRSICRANESLARANAGMRQREELAQRQARTLAALSEFHDSLPDGSPIVDVLSRIARSAAGVFDTRAVATIYESADGHGWRLVRFTADARPYGSRILEPPAGAIPIDALVRDMMLTAPAVSLMPWLSEYLPGEIDLEDLRMFPIACEGTGSAILVLESTVDTRAHRDENRGLIRSWRAALVAGAQHDSAAHLTEQLAEANRSLMEVQGALAHSRTLKTLGEVAAGAAHEMNNPLTIISGRGQILATRLLDDDHRRMAEEIVEQSHRLSDMITALRSFAEPLEPSVRAVDLADLVVRVVQQNCGEGVRQPRVNTTFAQALPLVHLDPELIGSALGELIRNAVQAKGSQHIELRVQTTRPDDRLKIEVRDDGEGMTENTLEHAFDPFFSAQAAGRQPGLGLARARRSVEAHGGRITLVNGRDGGAVATIWLTDWKGAAPAAGPGAETDESGETGEIKRRHDGGRSSESDEREAA